MGKTIKELRIENIALKKRAELDELGEFLDSGLISHDEFFNKTVMVSAEYFDQKEKVEKGI